MNKNVTDFPSPPPIPVDSLHHDKDLLPGTVSAWLASDDGLSENRFQATHIWKGRSGEGSEEDLLNLHTGICIPTWDCY